MGQQLLPLEQLGGPARALRAFRRLLFLEPSELEGSPLLKELPRPEVCWLLARLLPCDRMPWLPCAAVRAGGQLTTEGAAQARGAYTARWDAEFFWLQSVVFLLPPGVTAHHPLSGRTPMGHKNARTSPAGAAPPLLPRATRPGVAARAERAHTHPGAALPAAARCMLPAEGQRKLARCHPALRSPSNPQLAVLTARWACTPLTPTLPPAASCCPAVLSVAGWAQPGGDVEVHSDSPGGLRSQGKGRRGHGAAAASDAPLGGLGRLTRR